MHEDYRTRSRVRAYWRGRLPPERLPSIAERGWRLLVAHVEEGRTYAEPGRAQQLSSWRVQRLVERTASRVWMLQQAAARQADRSDPAPEG